MLKPPALPYTSARPQATEVPTATGPRAQRKFPEAPQASPRGAGSTAPLGLAACRAHPSPRPPDGAPPTPAPRAAGPGPTRARASLTSQGRERRPENPSAPPPPHSTRRRRRRRTKWPPAPQRPGRAAGRTILGGRGGTNCGGTLGTRENVEPRACLSVRRPLSAGYRAAFSEPATSALRTALPLTWGQWCGPVRACASAGAAGSRRRPGPAAEGGNGGAPAPESA